MTLQTPLTRLLGTRYPIIQGGMSWASSNAALALAVSRAGGLGVIAAGPMYPEALLAAIREVRAGTDAPYAVNIPLYNCLLYTSPYSGTDPKRLWLLRSRPDQVHRRTMRRGPPTKILAELRVARSASLLVGGPRGAVCGPPPRPSPLGGGRKTLLRLSWGLASLCLAWGFRFALPAFFYRSIQARARGKYRAARALRPSRAVTWAQ